MQVKDFIDTIVMPQITNMKNGNMRIERVDDTSIIIHCGKYACVDVEFNEKLVWETYVYPEPSGRVYVVAEFQRDLAMAANTIRLHSNLDWYHADPDTGEVIMPPDGYEDVHTEHCDRHLCKYGDDGRFDDVITCTVVSGEKPGRMDRFLVEQIMDQQYYQEMYDRYNSEDDLNDAW